MMDILSIKLKHYVYIAWHFNGKKEKLEWQKNHYFPNFLLAKIICGLYIDDPQVDILKIFNLFSNLNNVYNVLNHFVVNVNSLETKKYIQNLRNLNTKMHELFFWSIFYYFFIKCWLEVLRHHLFSWFEIGYSYFNTLRIILRKKQNTKYENYHKYKYWK